MTRLGLVLDQVIHDREGTYSTDEAFGLFVEGVARRYFDRIEFCSRVKPAERDAPYPLDPGTYDVLPLPWYQHVIELCLRSPRLLPEVARRLGAAMERWDMLIVGGIHPIAPLALRLARRRGIPALLWIRGSYYDVLSHRLGGNPFRSAFGLAAAAVVLRAIPNGTTIVSSGRKDYRFLSRMGPTHVVYTSKFSRDDLRPLPRPARPQGVGPRILYVGRIAPEKGLEVLLEAFEELSRSSSGPAPTLSLAGFDFHGSSYAEEFHARVASSPVAGAVRFLGLVPYGGPLFALYDEHDVFALPSHTEGFPQVLFESMARGLPIVSTAVGGIPIVVDDGVNGLLVPPRSAAALARALRRAIEEPGLSERLADAGRATAARYTREEQIDALGRFLEATFPSLSGRGRSVVAPCDEPRRG